MVTYKYKENIKTLKERSIMDNQMYRLARIEVPAFTELKKMVYDANGKITENAIQRSALFSRMFSDDPRATSCERFVFARKSDVYCINVPKRGVIAYKLNDEGNRFVECGKYKTFKENFSNSEIKKEVAKELTLQKLTGHKAITISNSNFQNAENVELKVKNGDMEFECLKHDEYINCVHYMYIPIRKADGTVELRQLPYGQMLYRLTDTPANRNSYLAIPKNTPFITKVFLKEDESFGKMNLWYKGGNVIKDIDEKDFMKGDNWDIVKKMAIDESDFKTVDFTDDNTEFYMVYTGVMEEEKDNY